MPEARMNFPHAHRKTSCALGLSRVGFRVQAMGGKGETENWEVVTLKPRREVGNAASECQEEVDQQSPPGPRAGCGVGLGWGPWGGVPG